jgi:hypothetical protein
MAQLADAAAPWPSLSGRELGYRFLGYRLDEKRRPEFRFQFGEAEVSERFAPTQANGHSGFRRELRVERAAAPVGLWLRAAVGDTIEPRDGWHVVNNDWKTRVVCGEDEPMVRRSADRFELLVPITLIDGRAEVVQEIWW